mmetsp:Transcript_19585/g.47387  ORF Transcript_19585/g.47387 Transcript_19585/m.47387 type:complete len:218 (-) Transcript_19585:568-1221(-)
MVSIHLVSELKGISNTCGFCSWYCMRSSPNTRVHASMIATSVGDPAITPSRFGLEELLRIPHWARLRTDAFSTGAAHSAPVHRHEVNPSAYVTISVAVIHPEVNVPVLSEHNTLTQPRVSIASILRTSTFRLTIRVEAIIKLIVTVGSSPSGTCAKNAVAAFSRIKSIGRLTGDIKLATKDNRPTAIATYAMTCTKCSICISRVDRVRAHCVIVSLI